MKAKWIAGVTGVAGLIAGAVIAVPSGASAIDGPQIRVGQAVVGSESAMGDGEAELDYPLVVASNNQDDAGIETWANGGGPTLAAFSSGPASAALINSTTTVAGVMALRAEAYGPSGRGARFTGVAAQVQLAPARTTHPTSGQRGDLFVDKDGKLWFCKGGTSWKQLA